VYKKTEVRMFYLEADSSPGEVDFAIFFFSAIDDIELNSS
jgi:hypothetical protein